MKILKSFVFTCILLITNYTFSSNIAVVNIDTIIENNKNYKEILEKLEDNQDKHLKNFINTEKKLDEMLLEIEESKLIVDEAEINKLILDYNNRLSKYTNLVEKFNLHYQNQILIIREIILENIILLLENYATDKNMDLILDSRSYLIASNSLDITEYINKELNKIELDLSFEEFTKN